MRVCWSSAEIKNQQKGSTSSSLGSAVVKLDALVSWHQILNEVFTCLNCTVWLQITQTVKRY